MPQTSMVAKVVMKLGGGLITDKSSFKTPKIEIIDSISKEISKMISKGHSVTIIHGAGSFGHLLAKEWSLSSGLKPEISKQQWEAVERVRSDMLELCECVTSSLNRHGIECEVFPPSEWASETGSDFNGDLGMFERIPVGTVPITFGDVVKVGGDAEFGILSGDDLMARLSLELPAISHCIFLLGDVDGMMDRPPNVKGSKLMPIWDAGKDIETSHNTDQDVTGGIVLKATRASQISKGVDEVWFVNGNHPERISQLIEEGRTIGTKILG
jgi:isopentenyl phosphate kinase